MWRHAADRAKESQTDTYAPTPTTSAKTPLAKKHALVIAVKRTSRGKCRALRTTIKRRKGYKNAMERGESTTHA